MHSSKKNPAGTDLSAILEGLMKSGINFILVGGLAAVVQGAPFTTMDVDILHDRSPENVSKLFIFIESICAIHRRPDDKVIAPVKEDLAGTGHVLLSTRLGPLDILGVIEEGQTYEDLLSHTVEIDFRGYKIRVLDLGMLIELKLRSKDPKDQQRLPVLQETLRQLGKRNGSD